METISYPTQNPDTPPSIFHQIRSAARLGTLSKGARLLWAVMVTLAGPKGYVRYRICKLAETVDSGITQTKAYLSELQAAGLLEAKARPGHASVWIIKPAAQKPSTEAASEGVAGNPATYKTTKKEEERSPINPDIDSMDATPETTRNPENVFVVFPQAHQGETPLESIDDTTLEPELPTEPETVTVEEPEPPCPAPKAPRITEAPKKVRVRAELNTPSIPTRPVVDTGLISEVLRTTGDYKSEACWRMVIGRVAEEEIRIALSAYRTAINDGVQVQRPGAYALSVIKARNPGIFDRTRPPNPAPLKTPTPPLRPPEPKPEDREFARNALRAIRDMLSRKLDMKEALAAQAV